MKNYYLLNTQQYDNLNKSLISYRLYNLDGTEILVITSEFLEEYLFKFVSWNIQMIKYNNTKIRLDNVTITFAFSELYYITDKTIQSIKQFI